MGVWTGVVEGRKAAGARVGAGLPVYSLTTERGRWQMAAEILRQVAVGSETLITVFACIFRLIIVLNKYVLKVDFWFSRNHLNVI
jgi:hypothetical protein